MAFARRGVFQVSFAFLVLIAPVRVAFAQKSKPTIPTPTNTNPNPPSNPTLNTPSNPRLPGSVDNSQQIFLMGRVMFDDGSPVNHDIAIERVCEGSTRVEGHVDSKGRFSFTLGQQSAVFQDASNSEGSDRTNLGSNVGLAGSTANTPSARGGLGTRALMGCELRAAYPGYRSDVVSLSSHRTMDGSDVGTIILHRLGEVKGTTVSLTSAMAPKDATKAYERALDALSKDKLDVGERQLLKAVDLYPKYAVAWFELGRVQEHNGRVDEALKSYQEAIRADSKYVSPYGRMSAVLVQQEKWPEALEMSKQGLALNPVEFPDLWYCNAIALYRTGKSAEAAKSAKECVKLDSQHLFPRALLLLAAVNSENGDYQATLANLHAYLEQAPNSKNAEAVRKQLAEIEQNMASAKR
jgi:Tfp pilus assembly protein PilF